LDAGVWRDLVVEGSDDEEGEDSADVDDDAVYGEEDAESEDNSEFSDDDAYSDSSDVASIEELSEAGLSWDELDKVAEEEDRRNALRRVPERGTQPGKSG
jgi:hypothetical protein